MFEINGHTKQLGIIGYPVEHSFSPKMHNFISEQMGNNYVYSAWKVEPEKLGEAVAGMKALNIKGFNVTAPHKVEIMKYIDVVSEQARMLGSVNTVVNRDGKLYGYNTDSEGFFAALTNGGIEIRGKKILIIGAGGVVKPTLLRIIMAEPEAVTVVNRTQSKAVELGKAIREQTGYEIKTEPEKLDFDIVINTTSAGMEPQENVLPIEVIDGLDNLDFINSDTAVVDMIYNPDKTLFLREAQKRGAKILNGLGMLIYQGLLAYELFTDTKLPDNMADMVKKEVFNR